MNNKRSLNLMAMCIILGVVSLLLTTNKDQQVAGCAIPNVQRMLAICKGFPNTPASSGSSSGSSTTAATTDTSQLTLREQCYKKVLDQM